MFINAYTQTNKHSVYVNTLFLYYLYIDLDDYNKNFCKNKCFKNCVHLLVLINPKYFYEIQLLLLFFLLFWWLIMTQNKYNYIICIFNICLYVFYCKITPTHEFDKHHILLVLILRGWICVNTCKNHFQILCSNYMCVGGARARVF